MSLLALDWTLSLKKFFFGAPEQVLQRFHGVRRPLGRLPSGDICPPALVTLVQYALLIAS